MSHANEFWNFENADRSENTPKGYFKPLFPHNLGRPLHHPEQDYNAHLIGQIIKGYRVIGSGPDGEMTQADLELGIKLHEVNPGDGTPGSADADYAHYIEAGAKDYEWIWVPAEMGGTVTSPLAVSGVVTDRNDCTGTFAQITAQATGGTPMYEFSLQTSNAVNFGNITDWTTSNVFLMYNGNPLVPGQTYYIYLKDAANGNIISSPLTPNQIVSHTVQAEVTQHVSQPNGNDAEITVTVFGGVGPFDYQLYQGSAANPATGVLIEEVNGTNNASITFPVNPTGSNPVYIGAGQYFAMVNDATTQCNVNSSVIEVTQPQPLSSTYVLGNATCHQGTHEFTFNGATGGTAPYEYSITDPNNGGYTWSTDLFYDNIPAGATTIYPAVKDASGFIVDLGPISFEDPAPYSFTVSPNDTNCAGFGGSITFGGLTGGPGPNQWPLPEEWQFSIDNGSSWSPTFVETNPGDTHSISVPSSGTYSCKVRRVLDSAGEIACESPFIEVVVGSAAQVTASYSHVDDVLCGTNGSGEINITDILIGGQNASLNYEISWVNLANPAINGSATGLSSTTYDITGLDAATYGVTITDTSVANGCSFMFNQEILDVTSNIELDLIANNPLCNGGDGSVDWNINGGVAPFNIEVELSPGVWGPIEMGTANPSGNASPISVGSHTFRVTDVNGCTDTSQVIIGEPAEVVASIIKDADAGCFGESNGQLTANGTGGTGSYTYLWSNGETTQTITGLQVGTYSVVITDANGCESAPVSEEITSYNNTTVVLDSQTNISCNGGSDGSAQITVTGDAPFTYQWIDVATNTVVSTDQNPTGLSAGEYVVFVSNASGSCQVSSSAQGWTLVLTEPTAIGNSIVTVDESVAGQNDGSATITVTGGTPEYSVSVNGVTINGTPGQTEFEFENLAPGTYNYTIIDANSCELPGQFTIAAGVGTVTIDAISQTGMVCHGNDDATVLMTVSGGNESYEFSEDGTNWDGVYTGASYTYTFVGPYAGSTTYTFYVRDSITLDVSQQTYTITEPAEIDAQITTTPETVQGAADGTITISNITGGSGTYASIEIFDADGTSVAVINNPASPGTHSYNTAGAGNYTITITDSNGCSNDFTAIVNDGEAPLSITVSTGTIDCFGGNTDITVDVTDGSGTFRFSNDNGQTWTSFLNVNTYTFSGVVAGQYDIKVEDQQTYPNNIASGVANISQPTLVTVDSITVTNESIQGQNDGSVTLTVSGGTPGYSVEIVSDTTGNTIGTLSSSPYVFNDLAPDSYSINVTDDNGCFGGGNFAVSQGSPQISIVSLTSTSILCYGGTSDVTMTVANGSGNYRYSENPSSTNTPGTFGSSTTSTTHTWTASAGTWWFFVEDVTTGQIESQSISISQPSNLNISFDGYESYPGANDASVSVFIAGGTAPYSITCLETLENLTGLPSSTGPTPSGTFTTITQAGSYNFTIIDANGCEYSAQTEIITLFTNLAMSNVVADPTCYDTEQGKISIYVSGGSPEQGLGNYEFSVNGGISWSDGNYSTYGHGKFLSLAPGNYNVWVRDTQTGETLEWSSNPVEVIEGQEIQVVSHNMVDGTCNSAPSYSVIFTGSNLSQSVSNQTAKMIFSSPQWLEAGMVEASTGNANEYIAEFDTQSFETIIGQLPAFENGTFTVEITSDDCVKTFGPISYTTSDPVTMAASPVSEPECPTDDWVYEVSAVGGPTTDYILSISGGANLLTNWDGSATQVSIPQNGGNTVLVAAHTDYGTNGCAASTVITSTDTVALTVSGSVSNPLCATDGSSTMSFSITGGQPSGNTYKYKVSTDNGNTFGPEQSYNGPISNEAISDGDIVIRAYRISNGNSTESSCAVEESIGSVTNPVAINGSVYAAISPSACTGANSTNGMITMTVSGGTGTYQFSKDSGATWQTLPLVGGYYTYDGLGAGTYGIEVKDSNGCYAINESVVLSVPSSPAVSTYNFTGCWRDADDAKVTLTITLADAAGQANGDYTFYDASALSPTNTTGVFDYQSNMTDHNQQPVTITNNTTGCETVLSSFNFTPVPALVSSAEIANHNNSGATNSDVDDFRVWNISGGYGGPYTVELIDSSGQVYQTINNASAGNNFIFDVPSGDYTYRIYDQTGSTGCGRTYTTPMTSTQVTTNEETFYHFHMGINVYPFTDMLGSGNAYLIGDTTYTPYPLTSQANVDLIMTDLINNSDGTGSTCVPGTFEFGGPIDGQQGCNPTWTHNVTGAADYYYLAVPDNSLFNVNLVTAGFLQLNCTGTYNASSRRAFTYNGESYWLYKMTNSSGTAALQYGFK